MSDLPEIEPLSDDLVRRLKNVAVATLSVKLKKRGFNEVSIDNVFPIDKGMKIVGVARTLRFVPYRKDISEQYGKGHNHQKQAIDTLREGEVLVMEARGQLTSGTCGDIVTLRAKMNGAAGIVTDGAIRDLVDVTGVGLPVFAAGRHPAVSGKNHVPIAHDVPIACGGVTVMVGDVIVGDDDGVIVIPRDLVEEVLEDTEAHEHNEQFVISMVKEGHSLKGLFPMTDPQWKKRFNTWLKDNPLP